MFMTAGCNQVRPSLGAKSECGGSDAPLAADGAGRILRRIDPLTLIS